MQLLRGMASPLWFLSPLIFSFFLFSFSNSIDTITPNQSLKDGENLTSSGGNFAFGFFSPGNSKSRYAGIWYNKVPVPTVVWVANRENPVTNSFGVLTISSGNLVLIDGRNNRTLWSTNVSTVANYSSAMLLDSGNLVLRNNNNLTKNVWESFDYPTHTRLPGMKIGLDRKRGLNRILTSWKSSDDPARGKFSYGLDIRGMPQYFVRNGQDPIWRSGPWNGQRLSGVPSMIRNSLFDFRYVDNDDEIYFEYSISNNVVISRTVLSEFGVLQRLTWIDMYRQWKSFMMVPDDRCDHYAACGAYSSCNATLVPKCKCLRGFVPRTPQDWQLGIWLDGCVRRVPLDCAKGDGFLILTRVKLPDTSMSRVEPSWSLQECKDECLKNCSCTAYASANISGEGSGCVMWRSDLIDLVVYSTEGQDIYTHVAASELDETSNKRSGGSYGTRKLVITVLTAVLGVFSLIICGYCWWKKAKDRKASVRRNMLFNENGFEENDKGPELPLFDLSVIAVATDNFSEANILGKGGFGHVYKGILLSGQEIAVKRLSKNSGQGIEEFRNEVTLIAKLQHRNLVRILGYCIGGEEKMLIYEYMQNKSLDFFIFDQTRRVMLDWLKRFSIIVGIARGVLYLHEDSRLRIIHRDLKVSNVLLDDEMNPKISDFGMARIFGGNQTGANTNRVVGTYGYMSPEYAMDGLFSVKSDVFSFGVLLLEIISGKRNNNYSRDYPSMNLIGHVWELWKEGRALEIVDSSINESFFENEVLRCIQVGLLCVQENANDRPNMSSVVFMLGNETTVPSPKQPAFCLRNGSHHPNSSSHGTGNCSANEVSITELEAR